jgi:hypothetical protein
VSEPWEGALDLVVLVPGLLDDVVLAGEKGALDLVVLVPDLLDDVVLAGEKGALDLVVLVPDLLDDVALADGGGHSRRWGATSARRGEMLAPGRVG